MPSHSLTSLLTFLTEIDDLKRIERRSYVMGGTRRENSAEHSWHAAVAVWFLAKREGAEIDMEKALKMALVHDLCEIDPGDTFAHQADQSGKFDEEQACIQRLRDIEPELLQEISDLWHEFEEGQSRESKWVRLADRLLPFVHNLNNGGKTWREHGIKRSQVLKINASIIAHFPEIQVWFKEHVAIAVKKGWLVDE